MDELREILDEVMACALEREWACRPGRLALVVNVEEEGNSPSIFMWSPSDDDSIEVLHLWYDARLEEWVCVLGEGRGAIEFTREDGIETPVS